MDPSTNNFSHRRDVLNNASSTTDHCHTADSAERVHGNMSGTQSPAIAAQSQLEPLIPAVVAAHSLDFEKLGWQWIRVDALSVLCSVSYFYLLVLLRLSLSPAARNLGGHLMCYASVVTIKRGRPR